MWNANIREELRQYLNEADDGFVRMVYVMMKVNREEAILNQDE